MRSAYLTYEKCVRLMILKENRLNSNCFEIIFIFFQLTERKYRKGRDYLMWALLQFISGSIQRNPVRKYTQNI